jgi:NAD(P)-dependent dehydrogenase (short-subunit alcohol dehydrogenase family)
MMSRSNLSISPLGAVVVPAALPPTYQCWASGRPVSSNPRLVSYGRPEDIAATVAHLAGDGGRYVSGTAITVDGGFAA